MPIPFIKYSGCGNDFILIDNRHLSLFPSPPAIMKICHRQKGIGADGVIFLERSSKNFYRMRIFNSDGSEAEMCGNGLRCLAHFIRSIETPIEPFKIETMHQLMEVSFNENLVRIAMPSPNPPIQKILSCDNQKMLWHYLDTGVPHAVHFVVDIENPLWLSLAPSIRFHQEFLPKGTNVNFAQILPDQAIKIRTYERGVEQETLSCGTGAVASAVIAATMHQIKPPIKIHTKSGDCLSINFKINDSNLTHLEMIGPAIKVFEGLLNKEMFGF